MTSSLHGLNVSHQLTPTLTAIWKHPLFKAGGFYPGTGGLSMFYAGLDGTVTVNMGITVSGSATCSLDLPSAEVAFPAGDLGEVDLDVDPSLTFTVNGGIDVRATVTLQCGAYYEWTSTGGNSGGRYCVPTYTAPKLSAPGGIDASLKGGLDVSLTLDDTTGVSGSIDATAHLGFHPGQHPAAELDISSDWDIQGVLAKWWKNGPTITIASGTLLDHKVLWSSNSAPVSPPAGHHHHPPARRDGRTVLQHPAHHGRPQKRHLGHHHWPPARGPEPVRLHHQRHGDHGGHQHFHPQVHRRLRADRDRHRDAHRRQGRRLDCHRGPAASRCPAGHIRPPVSGGLRIG